MGALVLIFPWYSYGSSEGFHGIPWVAALQGLELRSGVNPLSANVLILCAVVGNICCVVRAAIACLCFDFVVVACFRKNVALVTSSWSWNSVQLLYLLQACS